MLPLLQEFKFDLAFEDLKYIYIIYHINRIKEKKHTMTSLDTEIAYDKTQHPLMKTTVCHITRNKRKFSILIIDNF